MKWRNYKKRIFRKIGKSLGKIGIFAGIICFVFYGMSTMGVTSSYLNDTATLNASTFSAGTLDLTVRSGQGNFVPGADNMMPGQQVNRDIYVGKTALSLPLKHNVSFEFSGGNINLCDQLDLKIWYDHYNGPVSGGYSNRDMRLTYNGKLSVLSDYSHTDFVVPHPDDQFDTDPSNGIEQWFYYSISLPSGIADDFQGEVCNFNFAFNAWQDNLSYSSGGFTDTEKLGSIIKVGYWNPSVVLNEFLPNAGEYPEFIELFNKSASPINLNGFYIKANDNVIPINISTTDDYSGGDTTIPANGWLVVTAGGDLINNNSGTIALYNGNDVVVDSYTYGSPDHNVNNTPGWTNNLVGYWPFDEDFQDLSGNGNNGANYGAATVSGKINQGLSFDGINDYVEVADSVSLDITNQITVEGWIKLNSFSQRPTIAGKWRDISGINERGYLLTVSTDGSPQFYISTTGVNYSKAGSSPLSIGQWYHLVGTYDEVNIKLYVNGVLSATTPQAGDIHLNNESLLIGANDGWGGTTRKFTDGFIDEVKIYNRVLGADEVFTHYNDVSSSGVVPVDKSYARIPDGVGAWVDPIPTPGGTNVLDREIEEILVETGETPAETVEMIEATEEPVVEIEISDEGLANEVFEEITGDEVVEEVIEEAAETVIEEVPVESTEEIIPEIVPEEPAVIETPPAVVEEQPTMVEEAIIEEQPAIEEQSVVVEEPITVEPPVPPPVDSLVPIE